MRSLGIIGFGSFGRFAAKHLNPYFDVAVADRQLPVIDAGERDLANVKSVTVEQAAAREIVLLAVPVQSLEELVCSLSAHWSSGALVIDVASVKERPAQILERYLPPRVSFVGLHPMFGPQSGKDGIEGLKVVQCLDPDSKMAADEQQQRCVARFMEKLGLRVMTMSAVDHDREMAYIQGLTHWIAKALREVRLPDFELATPAYRHLLKIEEILREDSIELFMTIQRENAFAKPARAELKARLRQIETMIELGTAVDPELIEAATD